MKAILNEAAEAAVKNVTARVLSFSPDIVKSGSVAINAIILEFAASSTQTQLEALSRRMASPTARRRGLLKLLAECTKNDDLEAFQTLEKVAKKLQKKKKLEPKLSTIEQKINSNFSAQKPEI